MRARINKVKMVMVTALLLIAMMAGAQIRQVATSAPQSDSTAKLTATQQELKSRIFEQAGNAMAARELMRSDSIENADGAKFQASLLTCGPGPEIYEYYGHSAIRICRIDSAGLDLTFNYGVFDFTSDNFALRFALGETDYICAMQETSDFIEHYRRRGIYIDEQVLNMSQDEITRMLNSLTINCQPENRTYRYNFFFDNCATRVRDMIEHSLNGKIEYPQRPTTRTLRDAVHFYSSAYKWSTFGQDLLIGQRADQPATGTELQFAPLILQQDFNSAVRTSLTGMVSPIVKEQHRLLDLPPIAAQPAFPVTPLAIAIIMLAGAIGLGAWEYRKGRICWQADTALLALQGLAGCLVAFLFLFSTHPTVGSNWLIWVLNPLPLIGIYWQMRGARQQRYKDYHVVSAMVIAGFLLATLFIKQVLGTEIIILVLCLLIRNMTNMMVWLKLQRQKRQQQSPRR